MGERHGRRRSLMGNCIVYTNPDGGVDLCWPMPQAVEWLRHGSFWAAMPRGFVEEQIRRFVEAGHPEWAVARYARAMTFGGCTTAEALGMIRDKDCAHRGTAHELCGADELPDKWFLGAWTRSHNGGPIAIDLRKAKRIQYRRLTAAAAKSRATLQLGRWRDRIRKAETPEELRRLWPDGLI